MTKLSRIVGVSSLFASCATPGVPGSADPATRARAHINELTSGEVPGIQYRVLAPGEVVFASAARGKRKDGESDGELGPHCSPDSAGVRRPFQPAGDGPAVAARP